MLQNLLLLNHYDYCLLYNNTILHNYFLLLFLSELLYCMFLFHLSHTASFLQYMFLLLLMLGHFLYTLILK